MAKLDHPSIIKIYRADVAYPPQQPPFPFFEMEYLPRGALSQFSGCAYPPCWVVHVVERLALGLRHLHGHGLLHRDIKPANIFLKEDDQWTCPVLADFGLVKQMQSGTPMSIVGTYQYMAPEQLTNPQAVGPATDIYALCLVLYELLAGGLPPTSRGSLRHRSHPRWALSRSNSNRSSPGG